MLTHTTLIQRIGAAQRRKDRLGVLLLMLLLTAAGAHAPTLSHAQTLIMSNIVVTQASASSAITISWQTNVATTGLVVYGPTRAAFNPPLGYSKFQRRMERVLNTTSTSSAGTGTAHSITISSSQFAPNTQVYYTIQSTLPDGSFSTTTAIASLVTAAVGVTAPVFPAPAPVITAPAPSQPGSGAPPGTTAPSPTSPITMPAQPSVATVPTDTVNGSTTSQTVTPVPTPTPTPTLPPKAIPDFALWQSNMVKYGAIHASTLVTEKDKWGNVQTVDSLLGATYYDALDVYLQIKQETNDPVWDAIINKVKVIYRDRYVMRSDVMGRVPGYWNFTNGLVRDYNLTQDDKSKTAALALANTAAFSADTTPIAWTAPASLSREVAYTIRGYLNAEKLGAPRRARLGQLVDQVYGQIDQWFVSKTFRTGASAAQFGIPVGVYYIQPFMVGLSMEGLIMYYEATQDPRVMPAVKICLDWLWANAWVPGSAAFWYDNYVTDPSIPFDITQKKGAPDLNLLIAPSYAWYARESGDMTYRDQADQIFVGGVHGAYLAGSKQFNQSYSYGFKYIERRKGL